MRNTPPPELEPPQDRMISKKNRGTERNLQEMQPQARLHAQKKNLGDIAVRALSTRRCTISFCSQKQQKFNKKTLFRCSNRQQPSTAAQIPILPPTQKTKTSYGRKPISAALKSQLTLKSNDAHKATARVSERPAVDRVKWTCWSLSQLWGYKALGTYKKCKPKLDCMRKRKTSVISQSAHPRPADAQSFSLSAPRKNNNCIRNSLPMF